jgi:Tfp pilus assembly protein PilX
LCYEIGDNMRLKSKQNGFALIAALLANLILLAVGIIAINLSTQDLRISMKTVGDTMASNAAEAGLHWVTVQFDSATYPALVSTINLVDSSSNSEYIINNIQEATTGPAQIPLPGFAMGGGQVWGLARYDARISGRNTAYNTATTIDAGLGFGPVEMGTMSR